MSEYRIPLSEGAKAHLDDVGWDKPAGWDEQLYGVYMMIVRRTSPYARFDMRERYYGAGVRLWSPWRDPVCGFERFSVAAENWRKGLQIDRIAGGSSNYEPGNLRLVTPAENLRNRSNTVWVTDNEGARHTLDEIVRMTGISPKTIRSRYYSGWGWDKLTAPLLHNRGYDIEGETYKLREVYEEARRRGYDVSFDSIRGRVQRGARTWDRLTRPVQQHRRARE